MLQKVEAASALYATENLLRAKVAIRVRTGGNLQRNHLLYVKLQVIVQEHMSENKVPLAFFEASKPLV